MNTINLIKASLFDAKEIHSMQVIAFKELLDKYQDFETNPAAEPLDAITRRMEQQHDYYFIRLGDKNIGALRVVRMDNNFCRIAPLFIIPEYQGNGYAQQTLTDIEKLYPDRDWRLETIKEEPKLRYLYEKMGYIGTGKEEKINDSITIVFYEKHINKPPAD
ncbi:MAG: GNAT family N-acetyltransferase [Eubacterium sp.]|nr:GNAT family N-acetyltransferase [Eubacterium sp.]